MQKSKILILFLFLALGSFFYFWFVGFQNKPYVGVGRARFMVEEVRTNEEKRKGLAGHKPLSDSRGMLFIMDPNESSAFWMKGMTFPIDIIWIKNNKVIYIVESVPAPKPGQSDGALPIYSPPEKAEYVLEVKAGMVNKYKFFIGQEVKIFNLAI